jgi:hypothetical protein
MRKTNKLKMYENSAHFYSLKKESLFSCALFYKK